MIYLLDFETTGVDPTKARPLELYVAGKDENEPWLCLAEKLSQVIFCDDYPALDPEVIKLTGISPEELAEKGMHPRTVLSSFVSMLHVGDKLVAHNAISYDKILFEEELKRNNLRCPDVVWVDTRYDIPYDLHGSCRILSHIAFELGIPVDLSKMHRAKADVWLMADILQKYDFVEVLKRATEKRLVVQAVVSFDDKDLAKALRYRWQEAAPGLVYPKKWVKQIRESELDKEKQAASFEVRVLC